MNNLSWITKFIKFYLCPLFDTMYELRTNKFIGIALLTFLFSYHFLLFSKGEFVDLFIISRVEKEEE